MSNTQNLARRSDGEILRGNNYLIRWHDLEHTIAIVEVFGDWTWDDAFHGLGVLMQTISNTPHAVYTIFWLRHEISQFPGDLVLPKLHELVKMGRPNQELVIFVMVNPLLKTMLQLAGKVYGLQVFLAKYRFVSSFEQALNVVDKHKLPLTTV